MINLFEKENNNSGYGENEMNETDIFVESNELRPRRRKISRLIEEPEDYDEGVVGNNSNSEVVDSLSADRPSRRKDGLSIRKGVNFFKDLDVSDEIPEDLTEIKKEEVVLDAVKEYKEVQKRLKESRTSKEFYEVGRSKGRVEGMIEGFILACMNNGIDLEIISKKLVLTFNLDKRDAEDYIRSFYETRNIDFEEASYE